MKYKGLTVIHLIQKVPIWNFGICHFGTRTQSCTSLSKSYLLIFLFYFRFMLSFGYMKEPTTTIHIHDFEFQRRIVGLVMGSLVLCYNMLDLSCPSSLNSTSSKFTVNQSYNNDINVKLKNLSVSLTVELWKMLCITYLIGIF